MSRVFEVGPTRRDSRNRHCGYAELLARIVLDAIGKENAKPRRMTVGAAVRGAGLKLATMPVTLPVGARSRHALNAGLLADRHGFRPIWLVRCHSSGNESPQLHPARRCRAGLCNGRGGFPPRPI
jgi:hypothetical protein